MPSDQINPVAVEAMAEVGIDIASNQPKVLTDGAVQDSDVVITMGCGDACPFYPGKRYEDWKLDDPAGQGVDALGEDRRLQLLDVLECGAEVQVDPDDVVAGPGERQSGRLAHAGRAAQDQRPALAVVGHREGLLRRGSSVGRSVGRSGLGHRSCAGVEAARV